MSLQALLENVVHDAVRQARGVLAEARDDARRIVREAEEHVAEELGSRLQRREMELRRAAERRLAAVEREAREVELKARERYFERVFHAVRQRLAEPESSDLLRAGLAPRVAQLLTYLPDRSIVIHCCAAIVPDLQAAVENLEGVDVVPDTESPTRLTLEAGEGVVRIDDSLERRLEAIAKELRIELSREVSEEA